MKIEEALIVILENQAKLADMIAAVAREALPASIQNDANRIGIAVNEAAELLRTNS